MFIAIAGIVMASLAFAAPAPAVCLTLDAYDLERVTDRLQVPAGSSAEQRKAYATLVEGARERIARTFGLPESQPVVVFFDDPDTFRPFHLNRVGMTPRIGSRACVIIGPDGRNADVVAHELMHAEMLHRVGAWQLMRQVPAWFDEGVAMQVDHRERYDLPREHLPETAYVREFFTMHAFAQGENAYAAARREVGDWLRAAGPATLYGHLARIREGEPFDQVIGDITPSR